MKKHLETHGKNKREILTRKIGMLLEKTNSTTGRGRLNFENPPWEGTSLILMKIWITTPEAILKQIQQKYQRDQLRHHLITDYFTRLIR